ncbi:MAG TPA: SDR family oxidoreductase [Mycobacteriales bacterium]|nr:SDR family oxidoreductase [Mycobacteriales bacterium]
MGLFDAFRYDGKRVLVVGGATGMGAAVVQVVKDAGAEVVVMDRADVDVDGVKFIRLDLSDKASIESAIDECGGPLDALFECAGVADGTPGIVRINFIGHRHLVERAIEKGYVGRGGAIGFISSAAGFGWQNNLNITKEFLKITDFDEATKWTQDNGKADYMFSKLTINTYVAQQAFPLLKKGIRINAIMPGPTDTPLARANADMWLGFGQDYRDETGIQASTPLEQAYPLVFLCSDAAVGVTGITMVTDAGYFASGVVESFESAGAVVGFLSGPMYGDAS